MCHIYPLAMHYLPSFLALTAFLSAISRWMTFLQSVHANVHIAAIVFFDMLTEENCISHNITVKTKNRVG